MTPDRIKISEEFHINGKGIWIGTESQVSPGEDPIAEGLKAREVIVGLLKAITQVNLTDYNTGMPSAYNQKEDEEINMRYKRTTESVELAATKEEAHEIIDASEFRLNTRLRGIANSKPPKK
jgi:hypothetical protein